MSSADIRFYLAVLMKRLPYFILASALVIGAGIAAAILLPPVYRSSSKVLVEAPQISADLARSTVSDNAAAQVLVIAQNISTTASLVSLANKFGIYKSHPNMTDLDVAQDMGKRLNVEQLPADLHGAAIFNISFDAETPALAAAVATEVTDRIIAENVRARTSRAGDTLDFFKQEVSRLSDGLKTLEGKILTFKNEHADALPDSLDFRRNQQSSQQERLQLLVREEATLRSRRANLTEVFNTYGALPAPAGPQTPQQRLLDQLEQTLAAQSGVYAEDSPNVKAIKARIAAVRGDISASAPAKDATARRAPSDLDVELAGIDDRLTSIAQEKTTITDDLASLAKSIEATPANEAVLNALERDYGDLKTQHSAAVSRLADASTGEQIELRSKGERLTVLEPAIAPQRPFSPNRTRIALMAGFGGLVAGGALVALLEYLNKTVRRPVQLTRGLHIEPLATIPFITTRRDRRRRRVWIAGMAVAGSLVICALALVALHYTTGILGNLGVGIVRS